MFRSLHSWLLLVVLAVLCSGTAYGQDPPPPGPGAAGTGNPLDAETRADEDRERERIDRSERRDAEERLREWIKSISPEARENREKVENYYRSLRLQRFLDRVIDFSLEVRAVHALRFARIEEPWAMECPYFRRHF